MSIIQAKVKGIGEQALSTEENMVIFFDESATKELQKVSVIQHFLEEADFHLQQGDCLTIGDQDYTISYIGAFVNQNLSQMGHATLMFTEVPEEDKLSNSLYLTPNIFPQIEIGTMISYHQKEV